jgi:hypothetical protein
MQRTTRLALAGVTGAAIACIIIAEHSHFSLIKHFNTRACDEQDLFKAREANLPSNGTTSYNSKKELCVYTYTKPDGSSGELAWAP